MPAISCVGLAAHHSGAGFLTGGTGGTLWMSFGVDRSLDVSHSCRQLLPSPRPSNLVRARVPQSDQLDGISRLFCSLNVIDAMGHA